MQNREQKTDIMLDFRPPKDTPVLINLAQTFIPIIMKFKLHDTRVEVIGDGLERFAKLKGKRAVICPNHANNHDPHIMFSFSAFAKESFNFLAAREVFDWDHGWNGFWLQHMGCYSVVRGAVDRESFKMTKSLLFAGKKKLVIFPEGEISRQNDTLLPLESGVIQMSFWAVDELSKKGQDTEMYLVPIAIKYTYSENILDALKRSMSRLERKLGLIKDDAKSGYVHDSSQSGDDGKLGYKHDGNGNGNGREDGSGNGGENRAGSEPTIDEELHLSEESLYKRLTAIAQEILTTLEDEYSLKHNKEASVNERVVNLRANVLQNIANFLRLTLPPDQSHLDWTRIIRNAIDDYTFADESQMSTYERKIHDEKAAKMKGFYRDLNRVVNFIAIYEGYLREHLTQERFAEVVDRFEIEVFGKNSIKGSRLVKVAVGEPIELSQYYGEYKQNKRQTMDAINNDLTSQISAMLQKMEAEREKVFID